MMTLKVEDKVKISQQLYSIWYFSGRYDDIYNLILLLVKDWFHMIILHKKLT